MARDHYATLGVAPASDDAVIRDAYLALMRRYHPDKNPSAEAAARAQDVTAAYAVLRDWDRRADYDLQQAQLRAQAAADAPRRWPMPRPTAIFAAVSVMLLVMLVIIRPPLAIPEQPVRATAEPIRSAVPSPTDPPAELAGDPVAPIIAEASAGDFISTGQEIEPVDEPPLPVAAVEPPPQPRPPLARPRAPPTAPVAPLSRPPQILPASVAKPPKIDRNEPSFSCRFAKGRGETAVCSDGNLARLDRSMALLYGQSWARSDAAKRASLLRTRERFLARREACRSNACVSKAYLGRMREISDIMIAN